MFGDLKSARWIHAKGWLFLAIGVLAAALLLNDLRSLRGTLLLAVCIWGFCRFYYYTFYLVSVESKNSENALFYSAERTFQENARWW